MGIMGITGLLMARPMSLRGGGGGIGISSLMISSWRTALDDCISLPSFESQTRGLTFRPERGSTLSSASRFGMMDGADGDMMVDGR